MVSDTPLRWRRAIGRLASGIMLVTTGAVLVVAWQNDWWATLFGTALCAAWIVAVDSWSALRDVATTAASPTTGVEPRPLPLRSLLDQVPVPLVRTDEARAHAAARQSGCERVLPHEEMFPRGDAVASRRCSLRLPG